jgi:hypothetical protein
MPFGKRNCAKCDAENHAAVKACKACGHAFPVKPKKAKPKVAPPPVAEEFAAGLCEKGGLFMFWLPAGEHIRLTPAQTSVVRGILGQKAGEPCA